MPLLEFLIQIKIDFTNTNLLKRTTSSAEQEAEAKRQKRSAIKNKFKEISKTEKRQVSEKGGRSDEHEKRRQYNLSTGYQQDLAVDLFPNEQNFDLDKSKQKFHHSLNEHHKISNIPKFLCEML
jgi:hypothetical protein